MEGSTSGIWSEGTNPDMNTIWGEVQVPRTRTRKMIKKRGWTMRRTVEADSTRKPSSKINNQQNVAKMEIFMEAWCRFIDSRAKHADQESFGIHGSKLTIEELSDRLNSTHDNLRTSKSRIQIAWEHFPYKGYSAFIYLVVLTLSSFLTLLYGVWWVGLVVGLLSGPLSIYLFTPSRTSSTRFKKNWIYTFFLKLRLKLWKIPPPAPDNDMLIPKCIYVPLNKHQTFTWGEWLSVVILPKLRSELRITDMKGLDSTIEKAEYSLNDFKKYPLWVDGVMGPLGNVPLWCFWSLGVVGLFILIIGALYYESDIAKVVSLSGVAAFINIIYEFVKSNKENVEPDIEANRKIFDVICRLHRVIKKETIFFAVVANERDLNVIPIEYQRYFKFLIICNDLVCRKISRNCNYRFNMNGLLYHDMKGSVRDSIADIIFDCITNQRFIIESEEAKNQLKFLRMLRKINYNNNNVLTNRSMVYLVDGTVSLSYSEKDPGSLDLQMKLCIKTMCFARLSHDDLQAMGQYTWQTKSMIKKLKKEAEITFEDEDETTSMSETDEIHDFFVEDACIQTGAENKDKGSFKETDVEFNHCSESSETQERLSTPKKKGSFECDDEETRDEIIKKIIKNQSVGEANVIQKLSLKFMDLKNEDIETVSEYMSEKVKECEEFEIMYNKNIGPAGYENVGRMVKKHKVKILRLADCNISDEDIHEIFVGMGDAELEVLDIRCTSSMTPEGFEYVGELIAKKRIKRLIKLSDLQLNEKMLTAFHKQTSGLGQASVKELDVSYNSTMKKDAYKVLGSIVKNCGVEKLSFAGCGLEKEYLEVFRMELIAKNPAIKTEQKMISLNAGDNTSIGEGIGEIAKIVNECQLEELDISECRLSANELKKFIDDLIKSQKRTKLKCLYLGEKRQFDKKYISQVCNLLPHITQILRLKGTVCNYPRSTLQEELNKLETSKLEIKLDNDVTLCVQIEDNQKKHFST